MAKHVITLEKDYQAALVRATDIVFEMATHIKDITWAELAKRAQVSYNTVCRLGNRETRFPQWRTFWKLARAVGLEVSFVDATGKAVTSVHPQKARKLQPA